MRKASFSSNAMNKRRTASKEKWDKKELLFRQKATGDKKRVGMAIA